MIQKSFQVGLIGFAAIFYGPSSFAQSVAGPEAETRTEMIPRAWAIGPSAALTRSQHTGGRSHFYNGNPNVGIARSVESGSGVGYFLGVVLTYSVDPTLTLAFRAGYARLPGRFKTERCEFPPCDYPEDVGGMVDSTAIEYDLVTSEILLSATLFRPAPGLAFSVSGGLTAGYLVHADQRSEELGTYHSGRARVAQGWPSGASSLRLSAKCGILADLHVFDSFVLRPGVYYDLGLTQVTENEPWRVDATVLQIDMMLSL